MIICLLKRVKKTRRREQDKNKKKMFKKSNAYNEPLYRSVVQL